jgi:hypothetical protein
MLRRRNLVRNEHQGSKNHMKGFLKLVCLGSVCLAASAHSAEAEWTNLLDKNFAQWDVYLSYRGDEIMSVIQKTAPKDLKPVGLNKDATGVFSMIEQEGEPVLKITGEIYGAAATKQEFADFYFKAKFRWGEKKWEPRLTELKDSGILYFSVGDFGVDYWHSWMESQELQIIEGGIGDYWTIAGAQIDIPARKPKGSDLYEYSPDAPLLHFAANSANNAVANHCRRGEDREIPNAWNEVELVCYDGDCVHIANGGVVMTLKDSRHTRNGKLVDLKRGKIQIQSEAAEVFYKDVMIREIKAMPKKYQRYFQ